MSTRTKPIEYHLIDVTTAESKGGFRSLEGAREYAREEALAAWCVYKGDDLIERHEPYGDAAAQLMIRLVAARPATAL